MELKPGMFVVNERTGKPEKVTKVEKVFEKPGRIEREVHVTVQGGMVGAYRDNAEVTVR